MQRLQVKARVLRLALWTIGGLCIAAAGVIWYLINTDVLQGTFRQLVGNLLLMLVGTVLAYYGYEITPPSEGTIIRLKPERSQIVIRDKRGNIGTVTLSEQDYTRQALLGTFYHNDSTT